MTTTTFQAQARAFYGSDWRRMARDLKAMRVDRYGQRKSDHVQGLIDDMAQAIAQTFSADAARDPNGAPFSTDYFIAGTQVPEVPAPEVTGDAQAQNEADDESDAGDDLLA
jgi:hypothetical protein